MEGKALMYYSFSAQALTLNVHALDGRFRSKAFDTCPCCQLLSGLRLFCLLWNWRFYLCQVFMLCPGHGFVRTDINGSFWDGFKKKPIATRHLQFGRTTSIHFAELTGRASYPWSWKTKTALRIVCRRTSLRTG